MIFSGSTFQQNNEFTFKATDSKKNMTIKIETQTLSIGEIKKNVRFTRWIKRVVQLLELLDDN